MLLEEGFLSARKKQQKGYVFPIPRKGAECRLNQNKCGTQCIVVGERAKVAENLVLSKTFFWLIKSLSSYIWQFA